MGDFASSVDPDEVAHNEPLHLELHCLSSKSSQYYIAWGKKLENTQT